MDINNLKKYCNNETYTYNEMHPNYAYSCLKQLWADAFDIHDFVNRIVHLSGVMNKYDKDMSDAITYHPVSCCILAEYIARDIKELTKTERQEIRFMLYDYSCGFKDYIFDCMADPVQSYYANPVLENVPGKRLKNYPFTLQVTDDEDDETDICRTNLGNNLYDWTDTEEIKIAEKNLSALCSIWAELARRGHVLTGESEFRTLESNISLPFQITASDSSKIVFENNEQTTKADIVRFESTEDGDPANMLLVIPHV